VIRICGWCRQVIDEKPPLDDQRETTGICPECEKALRETLEEKGDKGDENRSTLENQGNG